MTIDRRDIGRIIKDLKAAGTDTQDVEVKESGQKLPVSIVETLSAFANATGGTIVLGLSEANGFTPVPGFRAKAMADSLATVSSDKMIPPVRPDIDIAEYNGAQYVVAHVPECIPRDKPCYVAERGVYQGSFIRVSDGDRKLSSYEVDRLLENRLQPSFDIEPIQQARCEDLDPDLVNAVLARQRQLHPRIFASLPDEDALVSLHVLARDENGRTAPTLAGLLALGTYPQSIFPRLTVVFTAYEDGAGDSPATTYADAETMAGPIPAILEDTLAAVQRNMHIGEVPSTAAQSAEGVPDYPLAAVREAVANALMHRDYSPASRGSAIHVILYPDRLEVVSPGGLYGTLTLEDLSTPGHFSTRNQFLSSLLESVPYKGGYLIEGWGAGYRLMEHELARAGLEGPEVHDSISRFTLIIRRPTQAPATLGDNPGFSDDVLAFLAGVPDASAAEIAAATGLARSTVTYRIRKLESLELVERIGEPRSPKQRYRLAARS